METGKSIETLLLDAARQMRNGEFVSFIKSRSRLEAIDLVDISNDINPRQLLTLYLTRHFVLDVLSNISGAATFSFPDKGSEFGRKLIILIKQTGIFLESMIQDDQDGEKSMIALEMAVSNFYNLLSEITHAAYESDLRNLR